MNTTQIKKTKKTKKSKNDAIRDLFLKSWSTKNQRSKVYELCNKMPNEFMRVASKYLGEFEIFRRSLAPNELKEICAVINETSFNELADRVIQSYEYNIKNPIVIYHTMSYFQGLKNKKDMHDFLVNHFTIDEIAAELEYSGRVFDRNMSSSCYKLTLELLSKSSTHQAVFDKFSKGFISALADKFSYDILYKARTNSNKLTSIDPVTNSLQYAILLRYSRYYTEVRLAGFFVSSTEDLKKAMERLGRVKSKTLLLGNANLFLQYVTHDIIETSCLNAKDWILIIKKHHESIQKSGTFPLSIESVQHLKNEFLLEVLTGTKHSSHTKKSLTLIDEILETYFKEEQGVE